jgi:HK97 family phage portal protein
MNLIKSTLSLIGYEQKAAGPDWGVLERFLAWQFGGGASSSGIVVNPQTAMQAGAVYSCVQVLSQTVGMLPLNIWTKELARTLAEDHPLFELLHHQPNDYQTSTEFWEMMVVALCLRGNAYAFANRAPSGRVVELLPLHPDLVRVTQNADWSLQYQLTMPDGSFKFFGVGDIFHIRGMTLNGWLGVSPIAYARESIGLALAAEKFGSQLFRNGAKMGGVLEHPNKVGDEAYKRLKDSFDQATSGENAHRTAVLEEGMKFTKISMSSEDAQFLETRKYQRSEIAAIYRVPPHMIGDLEKATFSNIEQQSLEFVTFTMMPWLVRIEKAIRRDLFAMPDRKKYVIRFDPSALLRGDGVARSTYFSKALGAGGSPAWMTQDEVRAVESSFGFTLNPMGGAAAALPIPTGKPAGAADPDGDAASDTSTTTKPKE